MNIKLAYADLLQAQREFNEASAAHAAATEKLEKCKMEFLKLMDVVGTDTYRSEHGVVSCVTTTVPVVKDWELFYDYILKTKQWELLQRRISTTAYRERVEAGDYVPGTETFDKKTIRVSLA